MSAEGRGGPGDPRGAGAPSEEELRAAYEAELKRITTADVVLQTAVSLINLGGRRLGRVAGAEDERDLDQVSDAIDAVSALMPVLERRVGSDVAPLRDALAQLQMAYAREAQAGAAAPGDAPAPGPSGDGGEGGPGGKDESDEARAPGPAESSGRLWIPGQ